MTSPALATLGILANPASGKDIRRLVAHASVFDNAEKVNMMVRLVLGAQAAGVERFLFMPDSHGLAQRAQAALSEVELTVLDLPIDDSAEDTCRAAQAMAELDAGCLVVLGGDGTCRAASKGSGAMPLLPVSTGTNNVFPILLESTLAGLAAGLAAGGVVDPANCTYRAKCIEVLRDGQPVDLALIDAVVVDGLWVGSRAVWQIETIREIVQTRATPAALGLSALGGVLGLAPIGPCDDGGLRLVLGEGPGARPVRAPIAPGLVSQGWVRRVEPLALETVVPVPPGPCLIALDGEREIEVLPRHTWALRLARRGPVVLDPTRALAEAARAGWFVGDTG